MATSNLRLEEATDADFPRLFALMSMSFGHDHPYIDSVYPLHDESSGRLVGSERFLAVKNSDPNTTFLKVVDESISPAVGENAQIIGVAKWNVYDGFIPEEIELDGDHWEDPEAKELAQYFFKEYLRLRRGAIKATEGHVCALDLMCIDPAHQRRGAGKMLVKWGTDIADKLGVEAVVEASIPGRALYEHFGFETLQHVALDFPEKWKGKDKQKFFWMVRPVNGKGEISEAVRNIT